MLKERDLIADSTRCPKSSSSFEASGQHEQQEIQVSETSVVLNPSFRIFPPKEKSATLPSTLPFPPVSTPSKSPLYSAESPQYVLQDPSELITPRELQHLLKQHASATVTVPRSPNPSDILTLRELEVGVCEHVSAALSSFPNPSDILTPRELEVGVREHVSAALSSLPNPSDILTPRELEVGVREYMLASTPQNLADILHSCDLAELVEEPRNLVEHEHLVREDGGRNPPSVPSDGRDIYPDRPRDFYSDAYRDAVDWALVQVVQEFICLPDRQKSASDLKSS